MQINKYNKTNKRNNTNKTWKYSTELLPQDSKTTQLCRHIYFNSIYRVEIIESLLSRIGISKCYYKRIDSSGLETQRIYYLVNGTMVYVHTKGRSLLYCFQMKFMPIFLASWKQKGQPQGCDPRLTENPKAKVEDTPKPKTYGDIIAVCLGQRIALEKLTLSAKKHGFDYKVMLKETKHKDNKFVNVLFVKGGDKATGLFFRLDDEGVVIATQYVVNFDSLTEKNFVSKSLNKKLQASK